MKKYNTSKELFRSEYVSYSRLSSYETCPQKFKLTYLDKIPCPVGRAGQLGSVVHTIIAKYLEDVRSSNSLVETDTSDLYESTIPTCKELREAGELTYFLKEYEIENLLDGFAKLLPRVDSQSIVGVEVESNFEIQGYQFKTITDLILCNANGKFTIIDFKTGKPEYVDDLQIQLYAIPLFEKSSASEIELIYAFLRYGELKRLRMTCKSVTNFSDKLIERVRRIEADKTFFPEPSFLCDFCGVREHCHEG